MEAYVSRQCLVSRQSSDVFVSGGLGHGQVRMPKNVNAFI